MKKSLAVIIALAVGVAVGAGGLYALTRTGAPGVVAERAAAPAQKKILYYRNPMNPAVTSPTPKKDEMGMDYMPVYEEEVAPAASAPPGTVRLTPEKIQRIGVRSEEATRRTLKRTIRTVGRVEPVEGKVYIVNAKAAGWVEKLRVSRTDQMVGPGEALLELYSPEIVAAEEEYLIARRAFEKMKGGRYEEGSGSASALLDAAKKRLAYLDVDAAEIRRLEESGKASRTIAIKAPASGSVTEKMVVEGQKVEAGEALFKIIDHSEVWVYGEVYEYELPYVKVGQEALLYPSYSPSAPYRGRIEHLYTHLGSIRYVQEAGIEVRTAKLRVSLPNPTHALKLGMYLNVEVASTAAASALSVPESAVIDTGERKALIVDKRDGTFEPRVITVGSSGDGYVEVLKGVKAGEWVVTSANFLIDSESNLSAAFKAFGPDDKAADGKATGDAAPAASGHGAHTGGKKRAAPPLKKESKTGNGGAPRDAHTDHTGHTGEMGNMEHGGHAGETDGPVRTEPADHSGH